MSDYLSSGFLLSLAAEAVRVLASAACAAIVGIFVVNRAKSRADFIEKRIDDLCADIRNVAELASEYWMKAPSGNELKPIEAKIQSRIRHIEEMRNLISAGERDLSSQEVTNAAMQFNRQITGGDFGVHNRVQSVELACGAHHAAVQYITALRKARLDMHTGNRLLVTTGR